MAKTINTNMIAPGTRVTMQGTLDEFTWYLNHLLEGEKLQKKIADQKSHGWKFPNQNARSEFKIIDPRPVDGQNLEDANIKNLLTYLKESKVYTDKEGVTTLECVKTGSVPLMGVTNPETGRIQEVKPTGILEAGQTVQVEFQCFATKKGNNGVGVNTIVFLEEPKEKSSLPNWDRIEKPVTTTTATAQPATQPATQPAQTPAQSAAVDGFVPVAADEDIPW